jgi:hypothetical protein
LNRKPGRAFGGFRLTMAIKHLSIVAMPYCGRLCITAGPQHQLQRDLDLATLKGRNSAFVQNRCFRLA